MVGPGFTEWTNVAGPAAVPRSPPAHPAGRPGLLRPAGARDPCRAGRARAASTASRRSSTGTTGSATATASSNAPSARCSRRASRTSRSASRGPTRPGPASGTARRTGCSRSSYPGCRRRRAPLRALLPAFRDARYLRVDGEPVFYVFRPEELPDAPAFVDRWQAMARDAGLAGPLPRRRDQRSARSRSGIHRALTPTASTRACTCGCPSRSTRPRRSDAVVRKAARWPGGLPVPETGADSVARRSATSSRASTRTGTTRRGPGARGLVFTGPRPSASGATSGGRRHVADRPAQERCSG